MQRERRFPRGTGLRTIQAWQDETRGNLRTLPKGAKHTLAHDGKRYLAQIENQLVSIDSRRRNVGLWVDRFGHIRTLALWQHVGELNEHLHMWRKDRSAATCNHRRDALMNLVRVLYGRKSASELSDLVTFPKKPPELRPMEREDIARVLMHLEPGSEVRIRLELMHVTGMRPSQMGRLTAKEFKLDAEVPHVVVARGKGGRDARVPLLEEGIATAREYIAMNAFGKWNIGKTNKALREAAKTAGLDGFTSYQIRHSFANGLRMSGADLADIQDLYGHTNADTTKLYAPGALEKRQQALENLRVADERSTSKKTSP